MFYYKLIYTDRCKSYYNVEVDMPGYHNEYMSKPKKKQKKKKKKKSTLLTRKVKSY